MEVDVYSDIVCPWCYIGKKRLEKACSLLPADFRLRITYRPFELNPGLPAEGLDWASFRVKKFGGKEKADGAEALVAGIGAEEGIDFRFQNVTRACNTRLAHRLLWWSLGFRRDDPQVQMRLAERLFSAYFTRGVDVGRPEALAAEAGEAGLDPGAALSFLKSGEGEEEVSRDVEEAMGLGISAVPTTVLLGKYSVAGAQNADVLARIFQRVAAEVA